MNSYPRCYRLLLLLPILVSAPVLAKDCEEGGRLYDQALGKPDAKERAALLERSLAACPETLAYYQLGAARIELSQPQAALEALRQARDLVADNDPEVLASILGRRAQAYLALKQAPEALAEADTARLVFARAAAKSAAVKPSLVSKGFSLPGPEWFRTVQRNIDSDPQRQFMTAQSIGRFFDTQKSLHGLCGGEDCNVKGFDPRPKLDLYILFDSDDDQPNAKGQAAIAELGKYLATQSKAFDPQPLTDSDSSPRPASPSVNNILLIGHTDKCLGEAHNQDLSERRARHVVALIEREYPSWRGRLQSEGRGETEPRYPTPDTQPECKEPLNRRVAVVLPR